MLAFDKNKKLNTQNLKPNSYINFIRAIVH
jgi:hypothetical protein